MTTQLQPAKHGSAGITSTGVWSQNSQRRLFVSCNVYAHPHLVQTASPSGGIPSASLAYWSRCSCASQSAVSPLQQLAWQLLVAGAPHPGCSHFAGPRGFNVFRRDWVYVSCFAAFRARIFFFNFRCLVGATERACVLPKGHRSDERGDDHRSPDGVWWNEGWVKETAERIDRMAVDALLRAGSEGPTTPITGGQPLTREALEKAVADYVAQRQYENADAAETSHSITIHGGHFEVLGDEPVTFERIVEMVYTAAGHEEPESWGDTVVTYDREGGGPSGVLRPGGPGVRALDGMYFEWSTEAEERGRVLCDRCGSDMEDGGSVGFYCPKKDCRPTLPKAEHTLTVDVGDMPPEVAATFIERLKVQWKRMAREVVAPLGREEFERQAEKMALAAVEEAVRAADKKLSEAAFIAELTALAKSHAPLPRVEGPTPSELTQWNSLSEEEKKALDEALAKQPPCTCEVDSRTCRFHRAPIVSPSEVPVTQWKPDSESSIQSRAGVLGEEFWLVRGGKDVYRLGYKDRSGRTILGDEGNCTCPNRDGASHDCQFHHPHQSVDVAQRVKERLRGGPVRVTVNGKLVEVDGPTMDYRAVVSAAGYSPERVLSVTYRLREGGDRERSGSLWPTKAPVEVANGMVFSVADTSNA